MGQYEAYKIKDGVWGIVFRVDESASFDQRVKYTTKRKAVSVAALLNKEKDEQEAQQTFPESLYTAWEIIGTADKAS